MIATVEVNGDDPGGTMTTLDIVIVNWNSGSLLRDCIAALAQSTVRNALRVNIVDNASHDGSCEGLDAEGLLLQVLRNPENRGFAAACNQAASLGSAPYILVLNPDTKVSPDTLAIALKYLEAAEHGSTGILGVRLVDDAGRTQRTCARVPTLGRLLAQAAGLDWLLRPVVKSHFMTDWDHQETKAVDQIMGAFLLIRRGLFERLGGFDERFFVYYEDVDLCLRAREAGAGVVHLSDAAAWHLGGGTTNQVRDRRLFYMLSSQTLYAAKHFGRGAAFLVLVAALVLNVPLRVIQAVLSGSPQDAEQAVRGGLLFVRGMPALLPMLEPRPTKEGQPC